MVGKSSTHQRSGNRGKAVHSTNDTRIYRPLYQGYGVGNDDKSSRENPSCSDTRNSTSNNKGHGGRRGTADGRSNLEDDDSCKVNVLNAEKGVELAEE